MNWFTIDLSNPLVSGFIMNVLKRNALLIACIAIVAVLSISMVRHCYQEPGAGGTLSAPTPNSDSTAGTAAAPWDWTLIGQALGALIAGAVGVWQLIRKQDLPGAISAGAELIRDVDKFRDTIRNGSTLFVTESTLAMSLATYMGSAEVTELHRALAKDLLSHFVITVCP